MNSSTSNKILAAVLAAAGLLAAGCAREAAQAAGGQPAPEAAAAANRDIDLSTDVPTEAEKYLLGQGAKITAAFRSESGLKAIVAERGMDKKLFYVTSDGKYLISGSVYDAKGGNVTNNDMSRAAIPTGIRHAQRTPEEMAQLWEQAGTLDYVTEGEGDRVVYVIFDPQCPYCHQLWQKVRSVVADGRTKVRWIPVAILSESSKGLAAAILQANDSATALTEMGNRTLTAVKVTEKTAGKLERNLQLLQASGYTGVPAILYQEDGVVRGTMSVPGDEQFKKIFR